MLNSRQGIEMMAYVFINRGVFQHLTGWKLKRFIGKILNSSKIKWIRIYPKLFAISDFLRFQDDSSGLASVKREECVWVNRIDFKILLNLFPPRPLRPLSSGFLSFCCDAKRKKSEQRKKNTRPKTVSKLNLSLVNSLRSNKTRPVVVSLRACKRILQRNTPYL